MISSLAKNLPYAPRASQRLASAPASSPPSKPDQVSLGSKDWHQDQIIYFPLTDRFNDGDTSNNYLVDRAHPAGFWGGDLKGLTERLDYLKDIGATTIWLSPLADNTNEMRIGDYHGYGHHGYWIRDHYKVEEHQGDLDDAKRLVQEAHKRGLKVVLDVVLNHVGKDHPWLENPEKTDWFHNHGPINDWDDPYQVIHGDLGGLPDLNQRHPDTYQYLLDNTAWWVKELGLDGVRLDAVKHIEHDFWRNFVPDLKEKLDDPDLFVMGEVFHGDPRVVSEYQRAGVDYVFDLPLYYTMREVFGQGQSMRKLGERLDEDRLYPEPDQLVTVLDNHDLPRFLSTAGNDGKQKLKQALAFLMSVRGVPSVYYGTESGFSGGHDPHNREMMDFEAEPELRAYFKEMTAMRKELEPLRRGEQKEMWRDDDVYAFSRCHNGQEIIAVFSQEAGNRNIPLREGCELPDGTRLRDRISGRETVIKDQKIQVDFDRHGASIYEVI